MCGLVGVIDREGNARRLEPAVRRAAAAMVHRGPDDDGFWFDGPVGLGFRRLSILDLSSGGHQPFHSQNGEWSVVFNGEIYNFIELAEILAKSGVQLHTSCDTEVLVEALALWGPRAFERFNGMWAVLAWHHPTQTMYACRDPWGIKPLFVCDEGGWIAFASEIRALRAAGCKHDGVQAETARQFLDLGRLDASHRTMYQGIDRLEPGWLYAWRGTRPMQRVRLADGTQAVDVPHYDPSPAGEATFQEGFRAALLNAVRIRLRADVDVGTCLSGGLDSTTIACAAARFLGAERVKTCRHAFTALMPEFDETRFIDAVIAQTGAEWHTTIAADDQLTQTASAFFLAHDEPVHSLSPLAGYLVMGLAAKARVKVLLNGQGADELLAGYNSTVGPFLRSVVAQEGAQVALAEAVAEAGSRRAGALLLARTMASSLARATTSQADVWARQLGLPGAEFATLSPFVRRNGPLGAAAVALSPTSHSLAVALQDQVERSPLPLYLRIEDANSSAFSLESRLPFLDPAVVAYAHAAPARLLRRGGLNKYLLRSILPGLVPDIVAQRRDKMGFPVPNERWLSGPLREMVLDTLSPDRLRARGWYDVDAVLTARDALLNHTASAPSAHLRSIFLLERWARDHLDASFAHAE